MLLKIRDSEYCLENALISVDRIFSLIEETVKGTNLLFSHLLVDGTEIYTDFKEHLSHSIESINRIEVELKTIEELQNELLQSAGEYFNRALPEISNLADDFYRGPSQDSWNKFGQLVEGLQWVEQLVNIIEQYEKKPKNWNNLKTAFLNLGEELAGLNEAMENSDLTLFADLLHYEISPSIVRLKDEIEKSQVDEGVKDGLN